MFYGHLLFEHNIPTTPQATEQPLVMAEARHPRGLGVGLRGWAIMGAVL